MITVIFATYAAGVIASLFLFGALSDQVGGSAGAAGRTRVLGA
ncbi:MAG: hypothetical protein JWN06_3563 [Propionibacteriaceae bacterium]|jgi:hypothetical protein|nr:hypothetical protein [Propionibacteriaceae bacterium]